MSEKNRKISTKDLVYCGLFAAFMAIGAFIHIMIPMGTFEVTFSLQFLFALLAGFLLGSRLGFLSVLVYLVVGLVGVPVYAHGGGPGYLLKPTYGFLIGFAAAAFLAGYITEKFGRSFKIRLLAAVAGEMAYYACGLIYYYIMFNFVLSNGSISVAALFSVWFLSTVFPDFILAYAAAALSGRLIPMLEKSKQPR